MWKDKLFDDHFVFNNCKCQLSVKNEKLESRSQGPEAKRSYSYLILNSAPDF